jgi:hypothetical protein
MALPPKRLSALHELAPVPTQNGNHSKKPLSVLVRLLPLPNRKASSLLCNQVPPLVVEFAVAAVINGVQVLI